MPKQNMFIEFLCHDAGAMRQTYLDRIVVARKKCTVTPPCISDWHRQELNILLSLDLYYFLRVLDYCFVEGFSLTQTSFDESEGLKVFFLGF